MPTIEEQLQLEKAMVDRGVSTYINNQRKAEDNGRGADLDYSRRLMEEFMQPLVDALKAMLAVKGPSQHGRARVSLRRIDPEKAMFIAMRGMFNSFSVSEAIVNTCAKIGKFVEDEIRFARFQSLFGDYYDTIIKDFKRKGTKDYRYMQRVLTHSANVNEDQWVPWSQGERADVGARLIDIIIENTDLCEKVKYFEQGKTKIILAPTESAKNWIKDHETFQQFLCPDRAPCIVQPDPWTGLYQGGYYSPRMRHSTPMVKSGSKRHRKLLEGANLSSVQESLNLLQETKWAVNPQTLEVMKQVWNMGLAIGMPSNNPLVIPECPVSGIEVKDMTPHQQQLFLDWKREAAGLHTQEKERVAKSFQLTRIMRMANEYSAYNEFWYVWYADFRGRLYTTTAGFSPQGPDIAKGLLRFSEGKPLGLRGSYWLSVNLANRYGYDKVSYDDRVRWVEEKKERLIACADDPLSNRDVWANADKPWQFLAAVMEYRDLQQWVKNGNSEETFVSYIPIGLDGSCNGLQNFSAMLRDSVGGQATNLVPSDKPSDIYSTVATVCFAKLLQRGDDPIGAAWLQWCTKFGEGKLPRKVAKRPVMTMPYGATRQSCTNYIFAEIMSKDRKFFECGSFEAAKWLTPLLWESIGEVVISAREAMAWLQKTATCMHKIDKPCTWQLADGFIATTHARKIEIKMIDTQLQGRLQMRIGNHTDEINVYKQRSGIAPNFVHSQDALHLRTTVRLARRRGITAFACIHDDYGTYAADTDLLHSCIRDSFVALYGRGDPLASYKTQQEAQGGKLPPLPNKGTLDIEQVKHSQYFFG